MVDDVVGTMGRLCDACSELTFVVSSAGLVVDRLRQGSAMSPGEVDALDELITVVLPLQAKAVSLARAQLPVLTVAVAELRAARGLGKGRS